MNKIFFAIFILMNSVAVFSQAADAVCLASGYLSDPVTADPYLPRYAFDNNPKTMWIENKPGPGIGESISIIFQKKQDIDTMKIMPGCFIKGYWEKNYRVKTIALYSFENTYTAPQLSAGSPLTLSAVYEPTATVFLSMDKESPNRWLTVPLFQ